MKKIPPKRLRSLSKNIHLSDKCTSSRFLHENYITQNSFFSPAILIHLFESQSSWLQERLDVRLYHNRVKSPSTPGSFRAQIASEKENNLVYY
jgi:hypothetical protein